MSCFLKHEIPDHTSKNWIVKELMINGLKIHSVFRSQPLIPLKIKFIRGMNFEMNSQWSKNARVLTEGWLSKIHIPCERGPYSHIKKERIFQICRGKFWTIFRENLGRVSPCPSTWHKHQKEREKILKKDPFSVQLDLSLLICSFWKLKWVTLWKLVDLSKIYYHHL